MGKTGKQVYITKIMPNSQAAKLETLNVGDIIEKIGPTYVTGMDLETIVNLLKNRASHCVCIFRTPHQWKAWDDSSKEGKKVVKNYCFLTLSLLQNFIIYLLVY